LKVHYVSLQIYTRRNLEINGYNLVAKDKFFVIMDTCDYKHCNCPGQVAKDNQSQKTPCGMYNCPHSWISIVTIRIFHPLTSRKTMRLQIWLHRILGSIFRIIKINWFNIYSKSHLLRKLLYLYKKWIHIIGNFINFQLMSCWHVSPPRLS